METVTLPANKRDTGSKSQLKQLRSAGKVPGVVYGLKQEPVTITIDFSALRPIVASGNRNVVIDLDLDGETSKVVIRTLEYEPVKKDVWHVDFLRVDDQHPVILKVPVRTTGIPFGVKTQGGVFSVAKKWVKVKGSIQDIPKEYVLDISELKAGTTFYAKELPLEKVALVTPPKTALFGISRVRGPQAAA